MVLEELSTFGAVSFIVHVFSLSISICVVFVFCFFVFLSA